MHKGHGDIPDELPADNGERVAAVDAAQQLLLGPTVPVPKALLEAIAGELEPLQRLLSSSRRCNTGSCGS